jgi:hypothetical protein
LRDAARILRHAVHLDSNYYFPVYFVFVKKRDWICEEFVSGKTASEVAAIG